MKSYPDFGEIISLTTALPGVTVITPTAPKVFKVEAWAHIKRKNKEGPDSVAVCPMIIDPSENRGLIPAHLAFKDYQIIHP